MTGVRHSGSTLAYLYSVKAIGSECAVVKLREPGGPGPTSHELCTGPRNPQEPMHPGQQFRVPSSSFLL